MSTEALVGYAKYDRYKDSGVDWLGEIPADWEQKRLKYVISERNERSKTGEEPLLMVSQKHGLVVRADYHDKATVAFSNIDNKIVYKNDLVFNKLKAHLGVFYKSEINLKGIVSPDYAVYKRKAHIENLKFLEMLFSLPIYIQQFIIRATGVAEGLIRLYTSELFDLPVPIPPANVQKDILKFIDDKSIQIDQAINLKQQQIEKLNEYKQIVIQNAVTKGLDANVEMKDSGIDWMGDIPEHWDVIPLKYLLKFHTGGTPESGNYEYYNGDLPWVTISNLKGRLTEETNNISLKGVRKANIPLTPKGSLLFSFKLSVGQVAFAHEDLYTNEAIATFVPDLKIDLDYYYYSLPLFVIHNANTNIYGAKLLNQELIKNAKILSVPKDEQKLISNHLNKKISEIDVLISHYKTQIEQLKEYKTILINQAVTGKIKVC